MAAGDLAAAALGTGADPPAGLALARLGDLPTQAHRDARAFCLAVIQEFYHTDYRPDWHGDLDSLTGPPDLNHYAGRQRGAFWTLCQDDGALIATAGLRSLAWKPAIAAAFADRYPDFERIASLWRVYVRRDKRRHGLGSWLTGLAEREAAALGYRCMYLHANSGTAATIAFWRATGYAAIASDGETTHFDRALDPGR